MTLNAAITDHETGTYTVTRRTAGTFVDGDYTGPSATTTFSIVASVQPVGEDTVDLPEGKSTDDARLVLTETALRSVQETNEPDTISIDGRDYRVQKIEKWDHWGDVHYEVIVIKLDSL